MALSGNLRDFSLPDVFQLISFSRKTGTLAIDRGDAKGFVYFKDGDVFFAISNWNREPMGRRLVHAEKITDRQLKRALELQESDKEHRRLGQILVDEGFLSPKVLETFVQEQIQDTIFDLFRWDEGEFDFKAGIIPTEEDIGLSVTVENIIMEGSRRLEEWNRIRKKIPNERVIFRMATAPGEGTFEISLKSSEWKLLCLLDGRRTITQLSELLEMSDFEVSRILYGMFSGGLLERVDAEAATVRPTISETGDLQATQGPGASVATSEAAAAKQAPPDEEETAPAEEAPAQGTQPEVAAEAPAKPAIDEPPVGEAPEAKAAAAPVEEGPVPVVEEPTEAAAEEIAPAEPTPAEVVVEEKLPSMITEAASAGPAAEIEEPAETAAAPADELIEEAFGGEDLGDEDELEVGEFDLTDELAALTGTNDTKTRGTAARAEPARRASGVPLHVDKRVNKEMVMKIIDGIKRL